MICQILKAIQDFFNGNFMKFCVLKISRRLNDLDKCLGSIFKVMGICPKHILVWMGPILVNEYSYSICYFTYTFFQVYTG